MPAFLYGLVRGGRAMPLNFWKASETGWEKGRSHKLYSDQRPGLNACNRVNSAKGTQGPSGGVK